MARLHSHQLRQQQKNWMHLTRPYEFLCLAVFTLNNATTKNRMHLTEPYEFLRFGCIHAKLQRQTWWISVNPRNSFGLIALTPIKAITKKTRCTSPNPQHYYGLVVCIPILGQQQKKHISPNLKNSCSWLHSHQIRPQRKTGCISPNRRSSNVLAAIHSKKATFTPGKTTLMNRMHLTKP